MASVCERSVPDTSVLKGWKRIETSRKRGLGQNTGKTMISYRSPDGEIVRSKEEMQEKLGKRIELTGFDFKTGTFSSVALSGNRRKPYSFVSLMTTRNGDIARPVRRTSPLFDKSVTEYHRVHPVDEEAKEVQKRDPSNNEASSDPTEFRESLPRRPAQVFWQKRLARAGVTTEKGGRICQRSSLPEKLSIMDAGLDFSPSSIYHSVGALSCDRYSQGRGAGLPGQPDKVEELNRHPNVFMTCDQPPIAPQLTVSEEDILKQETVIERIREQLVEVIKEYESLEHDA